jgi:hypothetical protein
MGWRPAHLVLLPNLVLRPDVTLIDPQRFKNPAASMAAERALHLCSGDHITTTCRQQNLLGGADNIEAWPHAFH